MNRMAFGIALAIAMLTICPTALVAQQETEIPSVKATLLQLRQYNGVLRLGISLKNTGNTLASGKKAIDFSNVSLIDAQSKQKYLPMKDADGHYLAGPVSDWNGGGRWFVKIPPGGEAVVWVLFEPLASGRKVSVQVPSMFPFDDVSITEGPPSSPDQIPGSLPPLTAKLVSAKRADGQLRVQIRISNPSKMTPTSGAVRYVDAFVFDPKSKQKYLPLKDSEGLFQAQPMSDKNDGGRWFPSAVRQGADALMSVTFPAPPDSVTMVDIVIPGFVPFEAVALSGTGGSSATAGVGVAGKSLGLEGALKDLDAQVTPQEIKIALAADVLFDFDKADIKPAAEPALDKVVTVLNAYPMAQVQIDGHTDGKGEAGYNQGLSDRRAGSVAKWLTAHSTLNAAHFHTHGWGATKPIAPNAKPDGSDDPEGRQKNRRVEITVQK